MNISPGFFPDDLIQLEGHHLDLRGWRALTVRHAITHIEFVIAMDPPTPPKCGVEACRLKNSGMRKYGSTTLYFRDLPQHNKFVDLKTKRSRFQCKNCKKVSAAVTPLGSFGPDIDECHRMTVRLVDYIRLHASTRTFCDVGREVGVPEATVRAVFKKAGASEEGMTPISPPQILGIDDKFINKKMCTVFVDIKQRTLLDIYESIDSVKIREFINKLQGREKEIEIVCQDMSENYRIFVEKELPWAICVVDKFHVLMKANEAVDKARNIVQREMRQKDKMQIFALRRAFLDYNPSRKARKRINLWFRIYPDLQRVWEAKERFFGFYNQKSAGEAEKYYDKWLADLDDHSASCFEQLISCFRGKHRKNILNFFDVVEKYNMKVTNGVVESLNAKIHRISRMAPRYGFSTLRNKLLQAYGPEKVLRYKFSRHGVPPRKRQKQLVKHKTATTAKQPNIAAFKSRLPPGARQLDLLLDGGSATGSSV